ncbi:MAG: 3-oxoacyl-ACP synthase [Actinobacteria bacterium RBG_16_64_13]|nr:MAG: 3-oxoacyl-ACP synthase [Actinobacteria bacterium RBG_16_64_13]
MPASGPAPLLGRPVTISGLGVHVPPRVVTNDDLAATLDTSDEWIRQRTGIRERRVAAPGLCSSDLGIVAARKALADAGLKPDNIDLVITATVSPDQVMPATASRIAHECGCGSAGAYDLSAGCTGFVYGMAMATSAVACGLHEHVLVVGTEVLSRFFDWEDRATAVLFGDGAGAAVVSPLGASSFSSPTQASTPGRVGGGILGFDLGGDGSGGDLLSIPAGGSRLPASCATVETKQHFIKMNGSEVFKFATRVVAESAGRVLERCGRAVADIDLFVPHQANARIIDAAAKKLGIPEDKVYTNLQRYGNTSCASIPLCLSEARAEGRLKEGDLVLLVGFGAGLTWGACLMEWGRMGDVNFGSD